MGWMATTQGEENLGRFFRRIALHVEAYVNGEGLGDRPIFVDFDEKLTMNFNTAELTGVPIKYSLVATTNFVGDFVNSIAERVYSLPEMIDQALAQNLLIDSNRRAIELAQQEVVQMEEIKQTTQEMKAPPPPRPPARP